MNKRIILQIINMLTKVVSKKVTREEGAMLLNDLMRLCVDHAEKDKLKKYILSLCAEPPKGLHAKTLFHVVALTNNPDYHDVLVVGLDHENEEISMLAAEGMAKHHSNIAKEALARHLGSPIYHVRIIAGNALLRSWGKEGVRLVIAHGLEHPDHYIRDAAAQVLVRHGFGGVAALVGALTTANTNTVQTIAEALSNSSTSLTQEHICAIVDAIDINDQKGNAGSVVHLLRLICFLKVFMAGYEQRIARYLRSAQGHVRRVAQDALVAIGTPDAQEAIAASRQLPPPEKYLTEEPGLVQAEH